MLNQRAEVINRETKTIRAVSNEGQSREFSYDKLLISTGAESARPPIIGLDQPGVFLLRWMADGFSIQQFMEKTRPCRAVIIDGGYIGLEMADALTHKGLEVTILEFLPEIMSTMDTSMGRLIRTELEPKGVKVITGSAV
jgi:NAD(P)H-nitrite reductase large subunit